MLRIPLPEYDGFALRPCSKKRGVRRGKRTLAEHGNVPVRRSVHDCVGNIFRVLSNKSSIRS